jgi:hypothetical protein
MKTGSEKSIDTQSGKARKMASQTNRPSQHSTSHSARSDDKEKLPSRTDKVRSRSEAHSTTTRSCDGPVQKQSSEKHRSQSTKPAGFVQRLPSRTVVQKLASRTVEQQSQLSSDIQAGQGDEESIQTCERPEKKKLPSRTDKVRSRSEAHSTTTRSCDGPVQKQSSEKHRSQSTKPAGFVQRLPSRTVVQKLASRTVEQQSQLSSDIQAGQGDEESIQTCERPEKKKLPSRTDKVRSRSESRSATTRSCDGPVQKQSSDKRRPQSAKPAGCVQRLASRTVVQKLASRTVEQQSQLSSDIQAGRDDEESIQPKQKRKLYVCDNVDKAVEAMKGGMSARKAASVWGVPRTTLQNRKKGGFQPVLKTRAANCFDCQGRITVVQLVDRAVSQRDTIQKQFLLDSIHKILMDDQRPNPFVDNRPGKGWFKAFLRRHPNVAERYAEPICRGRAQLTEGCIRGWFADAEQFFESKNCSFILNDPVRQYNGDETGFQLDPRSGKVIAPRNENIYSEAGGTKEQLTVLITTRADGEIMPAAIVYPYKRAVPKEIVDNVPDQFVVARSDSGWMTSEIFYEYMANCFIPTLNSFRRIEKKLQPSEELVLENSDWVVCWIDGYSTEM